MMEEQAGTKVPQGTAAAAAREETAQGRIPKNKISLCLPLQR